MLTSEPPDIRKQAIHHLTNFYPTLYFKEVDFRKKYLEGKVDKCELSGLTKWAFDEEEKLLEKWNDIVKVGKLPLFYSMNWGRVNKKAGLIF